MSETVISLLLILGVFNSIVLTRLAWRVGRLESQAQGVGPDAAAGKD